MISLEWNHAHIGRLKYPRSNTVTRELPEVYSNLLASEFSQGQLQFLDLAFRDEMTNDIHQLLPHIRKFKHMLLLGIGGSALGTRALQKAFFPQQDHYNHSGPWLWILDNVDPGELNTVINVLPPSETLVVVVSKSGGTIETLAQFFLVKKWFVDLMPETWREHFVFVTDPNSGFLREESAIDNIPALSIPPSLGGRYSVVSPVGMLPAAFIGLPWESFLDGIISINASIASNPTSVETLVNHPAFQLAKWANDLQLLDYNQLIFFSYIPSWASFGQWFAQLWAESLGKEGRGTMPIPAVGVTDQHSLQQMFLDGPKNKGCIQIYSPDSRNDLIFPQTIPDKWHWLRGKPFSDLLNAETLAAAAALAHHEVPLLRIRVSNTDMFNAGEIMGMLMTATVLSGMFLNINPLDQPAVELGKRLAYSRLGSLDYPSENDMLQKFMSE